MKSKLLILSSLIAASLAGQVYAATAGGTAATSCGNNQFTLSVEQGADSICEYNEKLTINGIESFDDLTFSGSFFRQIPLQEGDIASVTGVFSCSSPNGSSSFTLSDRTEDGCNAVIDESEPEPTPIDEEQPVEEEEFDPAALQEFQLELSELLVDAEEIFATVQSRADRFASRSPRFATVILTNGANRIRAVTEGRLDRAVNRFADIIEPSELLDAIEQFEAELDLVLSVD